MKKCTTLNTNNVGWVAVINKGFIFTHHKKLRLQLIAQYNNVHCTFITCILWMENLRWIIIINLKQWDNFYSNAVKNRKKNQSQGWAFKFSNVKIRPHVYCTFIMWIGNLKKINYKSYTVNNCYSNAVKNTKEINHGAESSNENLIDWLLVA